MNEAVLNVIEDIDKLIHSLRALKKALETSENPRKVTHLQSLDDVLCEELRRLLIQIEPEFVTMVCEETMRNIARRYTEKMGRKVSSHLIGRLVRKMGLPVERTRYGFTVRWEKGSLGDGSAA